MLVSQFRALKATSLLRPHLFKAGTVFNLRLFSTSTAKNAFRRSSPATTIGSRRTVAETIQTLNGGEAVGSAAGASAKPAGAFLWQLAGVGAVVGLGVVALDGLREGSVSTDGAALKFTKGVSQRITSTYGYVLAGLGVTAATATQIVRSGFHYRLMSVNPIGLAIGSFALTMGAFFVTKSASDPVTQHAAWLAFNASVGLSLFPVALMGGALVQKAAMGTAAVVGAISLVAATTRSDAHIGMRGGLAVGLGVVMAASFGSLFFPASPMLHNVMIYGGLAVFGGLTFYDTQHVMAKAKTQPYFNPLSESMKIYLDIVNIFTRIVMILGGGGNKRK
ncbi:hypothetical protein SARC_06465 [Sphaeroforma arctica JP610]|uniref:Growth hormone-inducible transmembrane protein n=1 Tax=Sphaeroforma arctica JP610 TaxID=667725 RepID=A0A0L0FX40_9EUKA|nr:hypothetical protein SARC_06465 [Sphaeroforma arctica JP610]KNC81204.1 hypothetical protein SARC_06465 [Sphaeroforma arctica JP610]|eukprot:XP_014155106.1 hypothetical protein SARC_06465 [Sphaeroforma arctica JP610]